MSAASSFRFLPSLAVAAVGIISLVPGSFRPHTGLPGPAEHYLAYLLTGFLAATQARTLARKLVVVIFLCLYSGSLEILQIFIPGRDPEVVDFLVSSAGAISGTAAFALIRLLWRRRNGKGVDEVAQLK